jgi:HD-GYP domain-containing protein (c-di-GMP phosphodiesterase class II)
MSIKVPIPDEWKERCELIRLSHFNKADFWPLHDEFLRAIAGQKEIDFTVYLACGWDLWEVMRPKEYSQELVKQIFAIHKDYPDATRVCIKRIDVGRFERLSARYKSERLKQVAHGAAMGFEAVFKTYQELSAASQSVCKGYIDKETYLRLSAVSSKMVMAMPSSKDVFKFYGEILVKDPLLYDHQAITALIAGVIAWNALKLGKREAKLVIQSALLHDAERTCAYLGRPSDHEKLSLGAIKEVENLVKSKEAFHEVNVQVMRQFREKLNGLGSPNHLEGRLEKGDIRGIARPARVVALACAISEFCLKRRDQKPLSLTEILNLIEKYAQDGELDAEMFDKLTDDIHQGAARKFSKTAAEESKDAYGVEDDEEDEDHTYEFDLGLD